MEKFELVKQVKSGSSANIGVAGGKFFTRDEIIIAANSYREESGYNGIMFAVDDGDRIFEC